MRRENKRKLEELGGGGENANSEKKNQDPDD